MTPFSALGWHLSFTAVPWEEADVTAVPEITDVDASARPVELRIRVVTIREFYLCYCHVVPAASPRSLEVSIIQYIATDRTD